MNNHIEQLTKLKACQEAIDWYDNKDSEEAWNSCHRGDWLLWICAKLQIDKEIIVGTACECAELSLAHVPHGENKPKQNIDTTKRWLNGKATIEEVEKAVNAAYNYADAPAPAADAPADAAAAYAAYAAAYAAATYAAYAAYVDTTCAAHAAYAAADAAAYAATDAAAYAAAYAATDAAAYAAAYADAAKKQTLKKSAEIVRKRISWNTIEKAIKTKNKI